MNPRVILESAERLIEQITPQTRLENVYAIVATAAELRQLAMAELALSQAERPES